MENINEECEAIDAIYGEEGIIVERPQLHDDKVVLVFNIKPAVGMDQANVGCLAHIRFEFSTDYPQIKPEFSFVQKKGLEHEQF